MDSGAYGSYPKRRGYSKRKTGRSKSYRKRVYPVNQYSYRKSRVGKLLKTDMQSVSCSFNDTISILENSSSYVFQNNGLPYRNLVQMLFGSPEFVSRQTQYSYYMLKGMKVTLTRQWMEQWDGTNLGHQEKGMDAVYLNLYPNLLSSVVGVPTRQADSCWEVSPFIQGPQTHYIPFPKNFTTGTNSNGLGVWNASSGATNLQGELAIFNDGMMCDARAERFNMWDVDVEFYLAWCNNTGI
nr:MAG: capsid protein [Cressdnaviricota sp.]